MHQLRFMTNATEEKNRNKMFQMINSVILWKPFDHKTQKDRSKIAQALSITHDLKLQQEGTHSSGKRRQLFYCLINRICNIKLIVDWWSLQDGKVTWRQASSQSQARAWGTFSKLHTGDSSVCNTEEPAYSRVQRGDKHVLQQLLTTVEGFNWCTFRKKW